MNKEVLESLVPKESLENLRRQLREGLAEIDRRYPTVPYQRLLGMILTPVADPTPDECRK